MKHLKLILILFFALTFSSCNVTKRLEAQKFENRTYNYNYIHQLYITNPHHFHYQTYYDSFGNQYYYYQHPYYIRYCKERKIRPYYPNRGRSNQDYNNRGENNVNYIPNRVNKTPRRTKTNSRPTNTKPTTRPTTSPSTNRSGTTKRKKTSSRRGG